MPYCCTSQHKSCIILLVLSKAKALINVKLKWVSVIFILCQIFFDSLEFALTSVWSFMPWQPQTGSLSKGDRVSCILTSMLNWLLKKHFNSILRVEIVCYSRWIFFLPDLSIGMTFGNVSWILFGKSSRFNYSCILYFRDI